MKEPFSHEDGSAFLYTNDFRIGACGTDEKNEITYTHMKQKDNEIYSRPEIQVIDITLQDIIATSNFGSSHEGISEEDWED